MPMFFDYNACIMAGTDAAECEGAIADAMAPSRNDRLRNATCGEWRTECGGDCCRSSETCCGETCCGVFEKCCNGQCVDYDDDTCDATAGTCNPATEQPCDGACIDKADACTCRGSNVLCDNMCIGALDKCCNDANGEYGCGMVETCCNGVCCGLNHECCDGKCVSSMGPDSCSAESDDDSGGSTAFRLSNRDKTILAALFLAVFFGFLAFKLFKNDNKQASTKKKKKKPA